MFRQALIATFSLIAISPAFADSTTDIA